MKLTACSVSFGMCVVGGEFFFVIGRAAFAQPGAGIPANFRANPFTAARTLVEVLFGFFDSNGKGIIVGFAADGALDVISAVAGAGKNPAENVPGGTQQIACHARH